MGRTRRAPFRVRKVKAINRARPPGVRPTAMNRSSARDRVGAGAICGSPRKTASILQSTPCASDIFSQLPESQSKPDATRVGILRLRRAASAQRPHGMIGTVETAFCGEPSMILSLIAR